MGCSVEEIGKRISSKEMTEWIAFFKLEPFGGHADDARFARLQCLLANIHRDPKKSRVFRPNQFMPDYERRAKTSQELLRTVEMLNTAFGGRDLRKK